MTATTVTEIADGIYRLSTMTDAVPGGFTFNQFLIRGDEALLFHTGPKAMFESVSAAVATVMPVEDLRWVSFGHWEADESGALNLWLAAAPHSQPAIGSIGTMLSGHDQAIRPPAPLADGDVMDLGNRRVRWIDTPHVPHGWDAGLLFEETTATLLCGDLFSQGGDGSVTSGDILGPAAALEDMMSATALTPRTASTIRRLADTQPSTLGLMHGPSFTGDGAAALLALADDYQARLQRELASPG
ncbi:MAG TPA: MBL fold metallo-hydrolase [Acidimicrobiales bacterium]|nr:MBL fold metallo-hydrolase [Acidimicrobiales bacterium]